MAQPHTPSMLEFMDGECVRLAREIGGADIPAAGALLMLEADGDASTLDAAVAALERAARGPGLVALDTASDEAARQALWAARKALSPAQIGRAHVCTPVTTAPLVCRLLLEKNK